MPTKAAMAEGRSLGSICIPYPDLPLWARGIPYCSLQNAHDPFAAITHAMNENSTAAPARAIWSSLASGQVVYPVTRVTRALSTAKSPIRGYPIIVIVPLCFLVERFSGKKD